MSCRLPRLSGSLFAVCLYRAGRGNALFGAQQYKLAIAVNIEIMRAFVKLRELLSSNRELAQRFAQLETRLDKKLTEHDEAIAAILCAIRQLMGKATH